MSGIWYDMDKYAGIERASGELHQSAVIVKYRTKKGYAAVFARWCIAAVLVLVAFLGEWIAHPVAEKVRDAFCAVTQYDMLGRENVGALPALDQIENDED